MTVASDRIQSKQLMIRSIRERIERDTHELNLVHEQLFTEGLSHEEFIRLTDRRNNLLAGIGLKEKELEELINSRRQNQLERVNYNY